MPTIQVTIDGETHEVDQNNYTLPENHDLVSPDNASSKGYFTEVQLREKVKSRLSTRDKVLKEELKDDQEFHKELFTKYNISLDDDGRPVGLKPDFDPEEWKSKKAKELTEPLENQLEEERGKRQTYKQRLIEQSILSATKGQWKEDYTKFQDDGRVKPIAVNQYKDLFDLNDKGEVALLDKDGEGFAVNAKGQHITADEYLTNRDKFGDYMVDNRQKGSGFNKGADPNGKPIFTEKQIADMSEAEFAKNEPEIMSAMAEGRVQK